MALFRKQDGDVDAVHVVSAVVAVGLVASLLLAFIGPQYRVWQQGLEGEAELMRAQQARRILVTQAQAEKDAATLRAEAIGIVGQAAKNFPEYRQQEFMGAFGEALREGHVSEIIYVPTEANIPILEAGKRVHVPAQ